MSTGAEHYREAERLLASTLIGWGEHAFHAGDRPSTGPDADRGAEKHGKATGHATTTLTTPGRDA